MCTLSCTQVPSSWANISLEVVYTVDVADNNLRGVFPREWSQLRGKIVTLSLDNNPGLTGCAPLDASTTVNYENTGMTGVCKANTKEVEAQQVQAVHDHLVRLLGAGANRTYVAVLKQLVKEMQGENGQGLGLVIKPGQTSSQFYGQLNTNGTTTIDVTIGVELFQGATYITTIEVNGGRAAGLNLTFLVPLAQSLPRLNTFICKECSANARPGPQDLQLPSQLAQAAPLMKLLDLTGCGLQGQLPNSWGNWKSLEALYVGSLDPQTDAQLPTNNLTGSIPPSYANLSNLKLLGLSGDVGLTGQLPPEFGSAGKMPINAVFYLGSTGLRGPIPLSWSYFSLGLVEVGDSQIDLTCVPDGLLVMEFYQFTTAPPCSGSSPQVSALVALQQMITGSGGISNALATWDGSDPGEAGEPDMSVLFVIC